MLPERISLASYTRVDQIAPHLRNLLFPIVVEHQERYRFAGNLINGTQPNRVIDAASGSGWGTAYLARTTKARQVIGIDFDEQVINESFCNFRAPNISFHKANLLDKGSLTGIEPAEWVVSFETVEHFPEEVVNLFLENLKAVISGHGKLIISTPNGPLFSPYQKKEGRPWYPYHYKEYAVDEFVNLLESNGLRIDELYGQRFIEDQPYLRMAQLLYPIRDYANKRGLPWDHRLKRLPFSILQRYASLAAEAKLEQVNGQSKKPLYLTALCS